MTTSFILNDNIRNSELISIFGSTLLSFIRPVQSNICNIFDTKGLKFPTRLRLGLNHLNEHRLRHNFHDCMNPLCPCSLEIEGSSYYLLHCHHFYDQRIDLLSRVKSICDNFESISVNNKKDMLLYGDSRFDENKNKFILEATINLIKILKDSLNPFLNKAFLIMENLHLYTISKPTIFFFLFSFHVNILIFP